MAIIASSLLVLGSVFAHMGEKIEEQEGAGYSMLQATGIEAELSSRIVQDEKQLSRDVSRQEQFLRSMKAQNKESMLTNYADGCSCACPASGCDEEKHQGPVCPCSNVAPHSSK